MRVHECALIGIGLILLVSSPVKGANTTTTCALTGSGCNTYTGTGGTFICAYNGACYCGSADYCHCNGNNGACWCQNSATCFCDSNNGACYGPSVANSTCTCYDNNGDCDCGYATTCSCKGQNGNCCSLPNANITYIDSYRSHITSSSGCTSVTSLSVGAILGIVFGTLGFCVLISWWCCCCRRGRGWPGRYGSPIPQNYVAYPPNGTNPTGPYSQAPGGMPYAPGPVYANKVGGPYYQAPSYSGANYAPVQGVNNSVAPMVSTNAQAAPAQQPPSYLSMSTPSTQSNAPRGTNEAPPSYTNG